MPNQRQLKSYPGKFHWTIVTIHKEQIARRRCPFKINDNKKNLCAIQSGIPESVFCENSEYVNPEMMRCFLRRRRPLPCSESVTVETEPVNASYSFKPYCTLVCSNKTKGLDLFFLMMIHFHVI